MGLNMRDKLADQPFSRAILGEGSKIIYGELAMKRFVHKITELDAGDKEINEWLSSNDIYVVSMGGQTFKDEDLVSMTTITYRIVEKIIPKSAGNGSDYINSTAAAGTNQATNSTQSW